MTGSEHIYEGTDEDETDSEHNIPSYRLAEYDLSKDNCDDRLYEERYRCVWRAGQLDGFKVCEVAYACYDYAGVEQDR